MISAWLSKESALPGVFVDARMLKESSLRRATVDDGCLHHRAESNFRSVPVAQTQCPSTSRRSSLEKSLSSPIMPCSRANFVQGTKQSLPAGRPTACRIVDRSKDTEVLTAKGQLHSTKPADHCARCFRSTPNCSHRQLARLTSLSFVRVGNESLF